MNKEQKLEKLKYSQTKWEIKINDKVVGFSARKTKEVLLETAQENGKYICSLLTEEEIDQNWKYTKSIGLVFADKVRVYFGQTQRQSL